MTVVYRATLALTSLALFAPIAGVAHPRPIARAGHPRPAARAASAPARHCSDTLAASSIYSHRALRQARLILQMKLLELREARLDRIPRFYSTDCPSTPFSTNRRQSFRTNAPLNEYRGWYLETRDKSRAYYAAAPSCVRMRKCYDRRPGCSQSKRSNDCGQHHRRAPRSI